MAIEMYAGEYEQLTASATSSIFAGGGEVADSSSSRSFSKPGKWVLLVHEASSSLRGSLSECVHHQAATFDSPASLVTYGEEAEQLRHATRTMYTSLSSLSGEDAEFGRRSWYVGQLLDRFISDPKCAVSALSGVLLATSPNLSDEARSAALRYAASVREFSSRPEFVSLCFSSLDSEAEQQAIAAARTLGDLGEPAIVPQLKRAQKNAKGVRIKAALSASIREIEQAYGVDQNTA